MWKGVLCIAQARVPVKLYSAVEEHDIRFRLLHEKDRTPVTQAYVHPDTDEVIPYEEVRRGYVADEREIVLLEPDELAPLTPKESRDIEIEQFLPVAAIDPQWYDRPYYLGPDRALGPYTALVTALERTQTAGIARWVMRKKEYVGALRIHNDALTLVTLRRAGEVVPIESLEAPSGPALDAKEVEMAHQLMQMLEAEFEPEQYRDEYRDRVLALIDAKQRGKKPKLETVRPKAQTDDLRAALAASLRAGARPKAKGKPKEKARASR
jgi:DNA end-binding protein Ku